MTIQSSGPVSLAELQAEFGGVNPISLSEYYKGGEYVPANLPFTATATNGSVTSFVWGSRGGYDSGPSFNTATRLYSHVRWSDGGWQRATITMTLPAGIYSVYTGGYLQGSGQYVDYWIKVGGVQVFGGRLNYTRTGSIGVTNTVTLTTTTTLQIYNYQSNLGNTWQSNNVYVGGQNVNTREALEPVNPNIPTAGIVDMNDFYNGRDS